MQPRLLSSRFSVVSIHHSAVMLPAPTEPHQSYFWYLFGGVSLLTFMQAYFLWFSLIVAFLSPDISCFALQLHMRSVGEICMAFVDGVRCTNPCLPVARHCLSRILRSTYVESHSGVVVVCFELINFFFYLSFLLRLGSKAAACSSC